MNPQALTVAELQYPRLVETALQVLSAWEETKVAPELWKPGEILTLQMLRVKLVRKGLFNALQEALAHEQAAIQGLIEYFRGINQPEIIQAADDETDALADRLLRDLSLAGSQPRHTDVAAEIATCGPSSSNVICAEMSAVLLTTSSPSPSVSVTFTPTEPVARATASS